MTIRKLIDYNRQKLDYLHSYLDANAMIADMLAIEDRRSIETIVAKKRAIAKAIDVIDDKVVAGIAALKATLAIADLGEIQPDDHPASRELKIISGQVLQQMVEAKQSDAALLTAIEQHFASAKHSKRIIDKNKLFNYTKTWLE